MRRGNVVDGTLTFSDKLRSIEVIDMGTQNDIATQGAQRWLRRLGCGVRHSPWSILFVMALFVLCGLIVYADAEGGDLSSSYVGCRLLDTHQATHLYAHDRQNFAAIGADDAWQRMADAGGYEAFLHPYVQTPLWGFTLRPLCARTSFRQFEWVFAVLELLSFAGCTWLVARYWAPSLFHPVALAAALIALWFSEPFRYAMDLMQTHILFLLLTVAAILLAEKKRPGLAGFLLACAAAVKITPAVVVVYWLARGRWKAAGSMLLSSALLWMVTVACVGRPLAATYLVELHRVSRVLLVSFNNQSFAAWAMARFYPYKDVLAFRVLQLPDSIRMLSGVLMVGFAALGGWFDRFRTNTAVAPMGAFLPLIAGTLFAPIEWSHYFVVLLFPCMALLERRTERGFRWVWVAVGAILLLNLRPISPNLDLETPYGFVLLRSQFYAGLLCLASVLVVTRTNSQRSQE